MSALGQKDCSAKAMSALPSKADMCSALGDVRFVPIADIDELIAPVFEPPRCQIIEICTRFTLCSRGLAPTSFRGASRGRSMWILIFYILIVVVGKSVVIGIGLALDRIFPWPVCRFP